MHIKEMRLNNFKSFGTEARLQFSPHTNIVLGRNGGGKSSLVAAIHFLMCGERYGCGERTELIHEGDQLGEESASVEIVFCNVDLGLPGRREVVVKRSIGIRKDEYMVDERVVSREEVVGLFQNAGFAVDNPYFIVMQGKITELAMLSERGRHELIKNAAGASKYENDREASICSLEETKHTECRIESLLDRIEDRLRGLEKEKMEMEAYDQLEKEKRKLEYAYAEREISELNKSIAQAVSLIPDEEYESEGESEEEVSGMKKVKDEIERLFKERNRLVVDEKYKGKGPEIIEEMRRLEKAISQLRVQRSKDEEQLNRFRAEEKETFVNFNYLKYLIGFIGALNGREITKEEIRMTRANLVRKLEELKSTECSGLERTKEPKQSRMNLEALIERRKFLWREERRLSSSNGSTMEMLRSHENKVILSGNTALNTYKQLSGQKGVIGCIYDLLTVPDELADAFEAVAGRALFNVVVEDENVAAGLLTRMGDMLTSRVTLMPLNRIRPKEEERIKDPMIISLTSQIKCDAKYKALLRHITRDSYLCSDLKSAVCASKKYGINVVTLKGDLVSKMGPISGGYEKKGSFIREYRRIREEIMKQAEQIVKVKEELARVCQDIDEAKMDVDEEVITEHRHAESLKAITLFLQEKLKILEEVQAGKASSGKNLEKLKDSEKNLKYKRVCLGSEMRKVEVRMEEAEFDIRKLVSRKHILESELDKAQMYDEAATIDLKITELRERERRLRESLFNEENRELFAKPKKMNLEVEKSIARKHLLIDRRNELCKKIGVSDFRNLECLYSDKSKDEIVAELIKVNERTKEFSVINRRAVSQWESHIEQKNALRERLKELKSSKECIFEFMRELDSKKEESISLTLSVVKENFSAFYLRLGNGGMAELYSSPEGVGIKLDGDEANLNALSGGQKSIIALCLIFSIQKMNPSPFYVFDEMDANLDIQSRERVAGLIEEMNKDGLKQFVITTFKKEMLSCGSKFFGVEFSEKRSSVREMEREAAYDFLNEDLLER